MKPDYKTKPIQGLLAVCVVSLLALPSAAMELTVDLSKYNYHETKEDGDFGMYDKAEPPFVSIGLRDWDRPDTKGDFGFMYTGELTYGKTAYRGRNAGTQNKRYYKGRVEAYGTYRYNETFTPFVGLGYRHLHDDSGGTRTSNGGTAYDRRSQYFYLPIGTRLDFNDKVYLKAQYNVFLKGNQKSFTSDTHDQYPDVLNEQDSGSGFDFALNYQINTDWATYGFYRHWDVQKSEVVTGYVPVLGKAVSWWEPDNTTTEAGIGLAYRF